MRERALEDQAVGLALPLVEDPVLREQATSDLFWDRVMAIEPDGEEDVFDLTVPGPSSWLADGIVSHNSGALEQDADVVMFIFRVQYYLERGEPKQSPDESDDKFNERFMRWQDRCTKVYNVAEVNIAKQRHGPIGTVELYFDGAVTKFGDLVREDHLPDVRD